ncbi:MAG: T9SS type A sorting domain-containing protein [Candidatus Cloacimonas sp.]|nr:T9SS type A sorting domain-containing protein [Candidatus Cloacimonas sp.]
MKRTLLLALCLTMLVSIIFAQEMAPGTNRKVLQTSVKVKPAPVPSSRVAPEYTFTKTPTSLITSYYDYMIGSYNGLPIRTIPASADGGYFITYHGQRITGTGAQRRAFYAYIDAAGNVVNNNEITAVSNREGYPTVAIDPISGKPLYAWHANTDTDAELEVQFASDAFIAGLAGLFNDLQVVADSPVVTTAPDGTVTSDNEFIWPTAQIGVSPVAGKRRIYMVCRNAVTHTFGPSENVYIAYADFDGDEIENGIPLVWSHTSIPEMDQWNVDTTWRRPFHAITTDNSGNVYYAGYHFATEADGTTDIPEPDIDVFVCGNYGQGTWSRATAESAIPSWNPAGTPGGTGYFVDDTSTAYPDNELVWTLANSSHVNATVDNSGKVHVVGVWAHSTTSGGYWEDYQTVKEFVFNPNAPTDSAFSMKEIYPQKNAADTFNQAYTPWDIAAPWGEPEYAPGADGTMYLNPANIWPFPYWDSTAHADAMFFHYNNTKITESNAEGMMAAVWQDSQYAMEANVNADPDFAAYANTPMIYISVTPDNGTTWSEPIVLDNVRTPAFTGIKPMWVYPSDKIIYTGTQDNHKVGKLGIMFYDDFTWGSNAIETPVHPTADGGRVMFTELQIVFPIGGANEDSSVTPVTSLLNQNYPNPFNPVTTISFDMPKAAPATLNIYNVKGQLVKTLFNGTATFGKNNVSWNGTDNSGLNVTSGIYFYRLSTDNKVETRKMMLMK